MSDLEPVPPPPPPPAPAGPPPQHTSPPRREERTTRKPLAWWDRIKILLLFTIGFLFLMWGEYVDHRASGIGLVDTFRQTAQAQVWLVVLFAIELVRQLHLFIAERSAGYYSFWKRFFGRFDRAGQRMNPWNRFRLARAAKWLFFLLILDLVLAKIFNEDPATALITLPAKLIVALPFAFQMLFLFFVIIIQFVGAAWFLSRGGREILFPDDIDTRFSDVKGQDAVLGKVKQTVLFLEKPEEIEAKGGKVPKGILLWGPPGTGKTLMAKAVAGETSKPFIFVEPGAFTSMWMGGGIITVKGLFRKARKLALRYGGVIMFLDEADALGNRGISVGGGPWYRPASGSSHQCNGMSYLSPETAFQVFRDRLEPGSQGAGPKRDGIIMGGGMGGGNMGTLPTLLSEMDGMERPRGFFNRVVRRALGMRPKPPPKYRILVMMATNLPQALDPALLRPGRLDRIYKVGYPSKLGRIDTYYRYLSRVAHVLTPEQVEKLATITPYYGGASIEDLVNAALINAVEEGRTTVEWRDVIKAKQLKDLGPPEDVEYIERERHAVAVHEACHAVVAYRARHHLTIDIATIEKGGSYLGMVASIPPEDQFTRWRSEYEADVMVSLASLAGEKMFFAGDSSSGVSGDLETATRITTFMEGYWGMGSSVTSHGVTHEVGIGGGGRPGQQGKKDEQDLLDGTLGIRIEQRLTHLLRETEQMLERDRLAVLAVAHALETSKTVTGEDVEAVIEGREGPILDGRPYRDREFQAQLERYHTEAVGAHQAHAGVKVPLPSFSVPFQPALPLPNGGGVVSGVVDVARPPADAEGHAGEVLEPDGHGDGSRTDEDGHGTEPDGQSRPEPPAARGDGPPEEAGTAARRDEPEVIDPGALPDDR